MATSNPYDLSGRVAMVTGAGSGIGRAIAIHLAELGASVGCIDLPAADLAGCVAEVGKLGRSATSCAADVTQPDEIERAVHHVQGTLGALSLAVNAAGVADSAPAEEMPLQQWKRVVDIDLTGVFLSCQAEGRAMITNGGGAIVNIASMSGTIANRGLLQTHYNSAKAGVVHLSKSLATEWAGFIWTAMDGYAADTPLRRNAQPRDIAAPVGFLLSEGAAFITGADLLVDGGFTLW